MRVSQAKEIATEWVAGHGTTIPGFAGAFFHGSIHELSDEDDLSPLSDLDILIVIRGDEPEVKPGKFNHDEVLLEVSFIQASDLDSPEAVLSSYSIAPSFRKDGIITDLEGWLRPLQIQVEREFIRRHWVEARCRDARDRVEHNAAGVATAVQLHEAVTSWLFAGGVVTHILLVAGLENPTVRRRYLKTRTLMESYGKTGSYPELLRLIGADHLTKEQVQVHLNSLAIAFDAAGAVIRTPFFYRADLLPDARPIAIDGSQAMIDNGDHREAVFWLTATYCRCMAVLAADAPELIGTYEPGFRALLADLGIVTHDDLIRGRDRILAWLPNADRLAQDFMDGNPEIT